MTTNDLLTLIILSLPPPSRPIITTSVFFLSLVTSKSSLLMPPSYLSFFPSHVPPPPLYLSLDTQPLPSIFLATHLPKLVAGESQNLKVCERLLQHIHVGVLVGVASVGGHIHDQHHLPAKESINHQKKNTVSFIL